MSDTPRTDAEISFPGGGLAVVHPNFAKCLERELNAANAARNELEARWDRVRKMVGTKTDDTIVEVFNLLHMMVSCESQQKTLLSLAKIMQERDAANARVKELAETCQQIDISHRSLEKERDQLRAERDQLQKSYDTAGEGIKACREAITALTVKRDTLQNELKQLRAELAQVKEELAIHTSTGISTGLNPERGLGGDAPDLITSIRTEYVKGLKAQLALAEKCVDILRVANYHTPAKDEALAAYDVFKQAQKDQNK